MRLSRPLVCLLRRGERIPTNMAVACWFGRLAMRTAFPMELIPPPRSHMDAFEAKGMYLTYQQASGRMRDDGMPGLMEWPEYDTPPGGD